MGVGIHIYGRYLVHPKNETVGEECQPDDGSDEGQDECIVSKLPNWRDCTHKTIRPRK
tara:strand:+ start:227 stop:400 length:174 start_codon:yes stop_codon:yes gene_type:complete